MSKNSDQKEHNPIDWGGPFKLYFRLSLWLALNFAVCAVIGLSFLSKMQVNDIDQKLSMRIGNFAGRVAGGLEEVAFEQDEDEAFIAGQQIILTLMSDPAIECAELRDLSGDAVLEAPQGLGCYPGVSLNSMTVPVYWNDDMDLLLHWKRDEVVAAEERQRNLTFVILGSGLVFAILSNLLAFRRIIGRPLKLLVKSIERAKITAEYNATHDVLTGLGNRRKLDDELVYRAELKEVLTILNIDLDGFKLVNDTLGHDAGDEVLRVCANRLVEGALEDEVLIRTGGDEFVVFLPPDAGIDVAKERAQNIIDAISRDIEVHGERCNVEASIGIDAGKLSGRKDQATKIVSNSDVALYKAKNENKGGFVVFDESMRNLTETRRALGEDIKRGLDHGEFTPYYQPQVTVGDHKTVGYEALARWHHPERGVLKPQDFISVAEEIGVIHRIDEVILRRAIDDLRKWDLAGIDVPAISLNVSSRRLFSQGLLPQLRSQDIPKGKITFEIKENAIFDKKTKILRWNIDGLRDLGIGIDLDEFGDGKASMASILTINPSRIKVAKELVQSKDTDKTKRNALRAVMALARNFQVELVAEGVETLERLKMVENLGFQRLQGFHIAPPMPPDAIREWVTNGIVDTDAVSNKRIA
ncbi:MAG: EAL domain-containing protein [Pseudomonadota bacterium]